MQPFILLIRRIMFFIDNNQFKIRQGGKDGGTRSDDQLNIAAFYLPPLIIADGLGDSAVQDGNFIFAEPAGNSSNKLGCQRDFGNQVNSGFVIF